MHVHWYDKDYLPLFTANGVTGLRIMWGYPVHHAWRKAVENGTLLGPRMVIASSLIDGPNPIWPTSTVVRDEAEARDAVRKAKREGADFIKVYTLLSRESFFAIADEAKKQGLPFAGHVPFTVSAADASDAGIKSIEHLTELIQSASSREEEIRKLRLDAIAANRPRPDPDTLRLVERPDPGGAASWRLGQPDRNPPQPADSYIRLPMRRSARYEASRSDEFMKRFFAN